MATYMRLWHPRPSSVIGVLSLFSYNSPEELHRMRVEHMERQLANLTGLVQKALINPRMAPIGSNQNFGSAVPDTGSNQGTLRSGKM